MGKSLRADRSPSFPNTREVDHHDDAENYRLPGQAEAASRFIDIFVSATALAFLMPLLLVVAIAVFLTDGGPVIFSHRRIGRHSQAFPCFKFRTMVVGADGRLAALLASDPAARAEWLADHKLRQDPRLTWLGNFLRKTSLDELPQFLNVLRGDMSIVGPRPIVQAEIQRYGRYFPIYCLVRPGITGLWQVSGRNNTSYRRRVALDITYVRARSFRLDLAIMAMTIPSVLQLRGSF